MTRDEIAKMRKPEPVQFYAKMTAHMTDQYIRKCDFTEFRQTIKADSKLIESLNKARGIETPPPVERPKRIRPYVKPSPESVPVGFREVVFSIAQDMDVKASDIIGLGRVKPVMQARMVAYKVLSMRGASLAQVGRWLGGRDHSTVINGLRKFEKDATPWMRELVKRWTPEEKTDDAA